jgi:hypothetical protein
MSGLALAAMAETIAAALDAAGAALEAGEAVALDGLDGRVAEACAAAEALPAGERAAAADALDRLLGAVDRVAGLLARQQEATRKRAEAAYGGSGA